MNNRQQIPSDLRRQVETEAGHRCAIPTCRKYPIDIHHIIPYETCRNHSFENLIALCTECHARHHRTKEIDRKSLQIYKANLGLLTHRYGDFGYRILEFFCLQKKKFMFLSAGFEPLVHLLIKDNILAKTGQNSGIETDGIFTSEEYELTAIGEKLLEQWKNAYLIQ